MNGILEDKPDAALIIQGKGAVFLRDPKATQLIFAEEPPILILAGTSLPCT
jgi:hypothetical protein